ncbi:MAG: asparagine synthase (glutamine-hydrolyzing) [Victivallales bacterium]|jgi:asparagine synthase (glutamine-hydrolysing)
MCGILGIFSYADFDRNWQDEHLDSMLRSLAHRGPDDQGRHVEPGLFLGHTRLAVLDLSPAGRQPMSSADRRFIISYNGEIYNFKELRRELENKGARFVSQSDTEVLLAAWEAWGVECLDRLDGIFAFALFDRKDKTLFLVRDHLGVKPLFYNIRDGQIFFASELLSLFGPLNPCPDSNPADLDSYFTFNYLPAPRTGLNGVFQLEPGCCLRVDSTGEKLCRYWTPRYNEDVAPWDGNQLDTFRELLSVAVKSQMVSDAPLGLFLSGGLDSYSVAVEAAKSSQDINSFTLGFSDPGFNEAPSASSYAEHLHLASNVLMFNWNEDEIRETLARMNELLADASCFPVYQLSRFARKKATVILAGDGGDELLAGYDTYKAGELTPYIRMLPGFLKTSLYKMARFLPSDNRRYGLRMVTERMLSAAAEGKGRDHASFRRIFDNNVKNRLYSSDFLRQTDGNNPIGEYARLMDEVPANRSYLTARQHADLKFHLPSILAKVDRMSMANGLEVRVPLLNRRMVEFCLNLPDDGKRHNGKGKRILREAVSGNIPSGSLKRPKAGFLPEVDKWFRNPGPMMNVFGDFLQTAKASIDILQWDRVEQLWDDHKKKKEEAGFVLLGILQFINWNLKCRDKINRR